MVERMNDPGLRYALDSVPGYTRVMSGKGYRFEDASGNRITDKELLARLKKLVIPPAWTTVWISPYENGHLQVTGYDEKGRKQYIYHPEWNRRRQQLKYTRLLDFGNALACIRKQVKADLRKRTLCREKVVALALEVMEETMIRVGNEQYRKLYSSYGLTTLRKRHVQFKGNTVFFRFTGKKGIRQHVKLTDRALSKLLKKVKDIPGQTVFQYYGEDGEIAAIDSGDLNEYLQQCTGKDFTSKDYRTWCGTLHAFQLLNSLPELTTEQERKAALVRVIDEVALRLGNTRSVCRKYYIADILLTAYERQEAFPFAGKIRGGLSVPETAYAEKQLLRFLKDRLKQQCAPGRRAS